MAHSFDDSPRAALSPPAARSLARGLGWFSLALGTAEMISGGALSRWLGMGDHGYTVRAYGAREITTGLGLLAEGDPAPWLWARIGGDLLDMASLATGLDRDNPERRMVALGIGMVAAVTVLDMVCVQAVEAHKRRPQRVPDYSGRRGIPQMPDEMRGVARHLLH